MYSQEKPTQKEVYPKKSINIKKTHFDHPGYSATHSNKGKNKNKNNQTTEHIAKTKSGGTEYSDYPKYLNTGNSSQDKQNYYNAKKAWASAHPDAYKKISGNRSYVEPKKNRKH
ncbi:MAG: hypothetical protein A2033_19205 [Bacteroidetes bacterium GWA2_31_9]|nr:MAG: hypothetical protein A2033_19205 [Bacteroidetes bacterium GWA2_31_9]